MIKGVIMLLGAAVITAFAVNYFSPRGIALFGDWDERKGVVSAKSKDGAVVHEREITDIRLAKSIYDRGGALFVDARTEEMFTAGHIAGAVSLPVGEIEQRMEKFIETHSPDTHIVTYCSGRECEDSHILADFLADFGFTNVDVFADGFPAWRKEGYPVE